MSGRKFLEQFSWDFSIVWNFDKSTFFIINIVMPWNWLIDWSQLFENQLSTFLTESVFSVQTHLHFLLYSYLYLHIYLSIHIHNIHIYKLISTYQDLQLSLMPARPLQKYAAVELALKTAAAAVFNAPRTAAKLNPAFV